MNHWIKMPNEFGGEIKNEHSEYVVMDISNTAITLYCLLRLNETVDRTTKASLNWLMHDMMFDRPTEKMKEYKSALSELHKLEYVTLYNEDLTEMDDVSKLKGNDIFRYSIERIDGGYFQAYVDDIRVIISHMSRKKMRNRADLICYYMVLQRRTNYQMMGSNEIGGELAQITNGQANNLVGMTPKMFTEYNRILEELGIFHISNNHVTKVTFRSVATRVARCSKVSNEQFSTYVNQICQRNGYIPVDKELTKEKISLGMLKYHEAKNKTKDVSEGQEDKPEYEIKNKLEPFKDEFVF